MEPPRAQTSMEKQRKVPEKQESSFFECIEQADQSLCENRQSKANIRKSEEFLAGGKRL
jgi:hypothetical protein